MGLGRTPWSSAVEHRSLQRFLGAGWRSVVRMWGPLQRGRPHAVAQRSGAQASGFLVDQVDVTGPQHPPHWHVALIDR